MPLIQPKQYRVRYGERLDVTIYSSTAVSFRASARVIYDDGSDDDLIIPDSVTGTGRTAEPISSQYVAKKNGYVTDAVVFAFSGAGERGQTWVRLSIGPTNGPVLCYGYLYGGHDAVSLGEMTEPGPGGGEGFLSWVAAFTGDRAGNAAAVDFDLFATNALRKVHGVAWYYHCSGDAATRTFNGPVLVGIGGPKPTGFTLTGGNAYYWSTATTSLTLTVNEEGAFLSTGSLTTHLDEGVRTYGSSATNPTPWPFWVTEDDTDTIMRFPAITTGNANDTHSAYVLIEEWLVP